MNIIKYINSDKSLWDDFVKNSKNSHFFFLRDYMEYHNDRFIDASLMFYDNREKLIAILPANRVDDTLYSHQGLTFGGLIIDKKIRAEEIIQIFSILIEYLKEKKIKNFIYKSIPHIYHKIPAQEDLYALFIYNAKLYRRDISSTIDLREPIRYSKGRKWSINKAKKEGVKISISDDYKEFWKLLNVVLQENHNAQAVHRLEEMELLANRFKKNIKLYLAYRENQLLAGAVIYENENIVHTQYLANSRVGRDIGALDLLIDYLIKDVYANKRFFDFGISNENGGRYLNSGLISQKESFGARAIAHDFYELEIQ